MVFRLEVATIIGTIRAAKAAMDGVVRDERGRVVDEPPSELLAEACVLLRVQQERVPRDVLALGRLHLLPRCLSRASAKELQSLIHDGGCCGAVELRVIVHHPADELVVQLVTDQRPALGNDCGSHVATSLGKEPDGTDWL